jgi:P27 family predicted phage terminase small subunit
VAERISNAQKIRMGTRRDRIDFYEPVRRRGHPTMPPDLSVEARKVWRARLRADVDGLITPADGFVLRMICEATVRYQKANKILDSSSPILTGYRKTLTTNPAARLVRDEAELLVRLERELRSRGRGVDATSGVESILGPSPRDLIRAHLPADFFVRDLPGAGKEAN